MANGDCLPVDYSTNRSGGSGVHRNDGIGRHRAQDAPSVIRALTSAGTSRTLSRAGDTWRLETLTAASVSSSTPPRKSSTRMNSAPMPEFGIANTRSRVVVVAERERHSSGAVSPHGERGSLAHATAHKLTLALELRISAPYGLARDYQRLLRVGVEGVQSVAGANHRSRALLYPRYNRTGLYGHNQGLKWESPWPQPSAVHRTARPPRRG